jgi:hypothetical protein
MKTSSLNSIPSKVSTNVDDGKIIVGYLKIKESFNEHEKSLKGHGSGGSGAGGNKDVLNIFARLTTKKKKMTECDKIQLSYFIHNQPDKT